MLMYFSFYPKKKKKREEVEKKLQNDYESLFIPKRL